MPTGFTEPLIDGKIKTFKEFAIICARGFGFASHLRDEDMDMPFKFKEVSPYYAKSLDKITKEIKKLRATTDKQLLKEEQDDINSSIEYHKKRLIEIKKLKEVFSKIEQDINNWDLKNEFPNIKSFMLQQLRTEDFKWQLQYHPEELIKYQNKKIDVQELRAKRLLKLEESLADIKKDIEEETIKVKESNDFAIKFFNSLK